MQNDDKTVYDSTDSAEYKAKLDAIANDPTMSVEEKSDAITNAMEDELNEISSASITSDNTATASEPASGSASASAEVTADPSTATYGDSSATVSESVPPAEAPTSSTVNDAIGVDGQVDYVSPRDVDGDGLIDLTHSRVDGIDTTTHYNEDGTITLIEQDTDSNGTYETAAAQQSDGTIRVAEDLDDDGNVDLATFLDPVSGAPVRQDTIEGNAITETLIDSNGDGEADVVLIDSDGNGRFDTAMLDSDADGRTNATLVDTDGDGRFDLGELDSDGDGNFDTVATSADTDLGTIESLEAAIPADDNYHAQAGTYPAESPSDL
ncbi:hypothetical protein [Rhodococcus sp. P1Y]|uniref:hypothetical protein n=1 Tax=Rhodococcus sp. P1Y TaxID=1302308 RepID=UPI001F1D5A09|nr:hypothetical protein [Rhodococcus sp. P1Y]